MTKVEQVADAINKADIAFRKANGPAADYAKRSYEAMARAAIEAMREPSREMVEGVMQASLDCTPINRCEEQALQVWQNTIDAILSEQN